jgi:ParB/RepB/Spo0J family partition protein
MTTTEPTTKHADSERTEPALCWLNLADLAPHPDNPRTSLGDLTELTRSIRSHGILQPLVVLPADEQGMYRIIAGHRRHAAGLKAELTDVPAVIRPMTATEVIEAMLSENVNRDGLTIAEEVRAIERLMSLDSGLTPAKLCKRIGRSQSWVRARMAVTILPARWRTIAPHAHRARRRHWRARRYVLGTSEHRSCLRPSSDRADTWRRGRAPTEHGLRKMLARPDAAPETLLSRTRSHEFASAAACSTDREEEPSRAHLFFVRISSCRPRCRGDLEGENRRSDGPSGKYEGCS